MKAKFFLFRLLFVGLIFYPTISQHVHIFEHHDHPVCEDNSLHYHEGDSSCQLLDYVSNAHAVLTAYFAKSTPTWIELHKSQHRATLYNKVLLVKKLRGPPAV